jgi:FkbM family methyltransferase
MANTSHRKDGPDMPADSKPYILPNGVTIVHRNKSESDFVFREIFEDHCYFRHGIELKDGDCVFDVGANIGLFSLYLSTLPCKVNVFAFEPLPPLYALLEENRARCAMSTVRSFAYGLAAEAGSAVFTYYPRNSIMSGRYPDKAMDGEVVKTYLRQRLQAAGTAAAPEAVLEDIAQSSLAGERYDCTLRTLSDVMAEHRIERIDLLKIDVERSELDVLRGIADADWPKIRQVVVEVDNGNGQLAVVENLLRTHGFALTVEQEQSLRDTAIYMVYAARAEK